MTPSQKDACRCSTESEIAQNTADNLLGDFSALLQQIGVHGLSPLLHSPLPEPVPRGDLPAVGRFLESYLTQILLPVELPAIAAACGCARRGQTRELIALDQRLAAETILAPFASASRTIGAAQLRRMKPLRDERTLQRYLAAVESGQASGWHTLVYGLTLAIYSFPLRQGLLHYGRETLGGLALGALRAEPFLDSAGQAMLQEMLSRLPEAVEKTVLTATPGEVQASRS